MNHDNCTLQHLNQRWCGSCSSATWHQQSWAHYQMQPLVPRKFSVCCCCQITGSGSFIVVFLFLNFKKGNLRLTRMSTNSRTLKQAGCIFHSILFRSAFTRWDLSEYYYRVHINILEEQKIRSAVWFSLRNLWNSMLWSWSPKWWYVQNAGKVTDDQNTKPYSCMYAYKVISIGIS